MLTVRDVMNARVVTVAPDTPVRLLARLLADEEISGAPVVDASGRLLGVVSATDVVRLTAEEAGIRVASATLAPDPVRIPDPDSDEGDDEPDPYGFFLPEDCPFANEILLDSLAESEVDHLSVADIMTPVAFSVPPGATLRELADFLVRGRIHRAVVMEDERLLGIVTSGDVLRAVADGRLT